MNTVLDVGSKESLTNVTNFLKTKEKIVYADIQSNNPEDIKIDLEQINLVNEANIVEAIIT